MQNIFNYFKECVTRWPLSFRSEERGLSFGWKYLMGIHKKYICRYIRVYIYRATGRNQQLIDIVNIRNFNVFCKVIICFSFSFLFSKLIPEQRRILHEGQGIFRAMGKEVVGGKRSRRRSERGAIRYFNKEYCKASQHTYLVTLNDYDKLTGLGLYSSPFLQGEREKERENIHRTRSSLFPILITNLINPKRSTSLFLS